MAQFNARPLGVLDAIYRFIGGSAQAPRSFQTEMGIIPVHDVSRESELGGPEYGQAFGYFVGGQVDVHAAPGTVDTTHDPWDTVDALGLNRSACVVWMIKTFGNTNSTANFLSAAMSVAWPVIPTVFAGGPTFLISFYDAVVAQVNGLQLGNALGGSNGTFLTMPHLIPDGSTVHARTVSQIGAANIGILAVYWVGPKGARPPGMA